MVFDESSDCVPDEFVCVYEELLEERSEQGYKNLLRKSKKVFGLSNVVKKVIKRNLGGGWL